LQRKGKARIIVSSMANLQKMLAPHEHYYPLDNSAIFTASTTGKTNPYVYRLSCELDERIYLPDLTIAVMELIDRFPAFKTELRPGFFWYYLDPLKAPFAPSADSRFPVEYHRLERWGRYLFRVRVYASRISCEFHHLLTDGTGALEFLRALVAAYLMRRGVQSEDWSGVIRADSPVSSAEYEDAYARWARKDIPMDAARPKAFNLPGQRFGGMEYRVTVGTAPLREALKAAKAGGASLTELLAACHLWALQELAEDQKAPKRPISVQVPVNLRKLYPSSTLRNFFLCASVDIDPRLGHYDFDEILNRVHFQMRLSLNRKQMDKQIRRNIFGEINPFSRIIPLPLKNLVLRTVAGVASTHYSGSISNLGPVALPEAFAAHVRRFEFLPSRNAVTGANIGIVSWQEKLIITVGSLVKRRDFERAFFRACVRTGIPLSVTSNM